MNATPQPHIRGTPANGDLTPWLSHEAVCPKEEMGVTGGAFSEGGGRGVCVVMGLDGVRILGQGLSDGLLICRCTGWGYTHQMGHPPFSIYLLSRPLALSNTPPYPSTAALCIYSRCDHG